MWGEPEGKASVYAVLRAARAGTARAMHPTKRKCKSIPGGSQCCHEPLLLLLSSILCDPTRGAFMPCCVPRGRERPERCTQPKGNANPSPVVHNVVTSRCFCCFQVFFATPQGGPPVSSHLCFGCCWRLLLSRALLLTAHHYTQYTPVGACSPRFTAVDAGAGPRACSRLPLLRRRWASCRACCPRHCCCSCCRCWP